MLLPPFGFGSAMVDIRMVLPLVLVFWASLAQRRSLEPRASAALLPWTIAAGITLISGSVLVKWHQTAPMQDALRHAMQEIEEGGKVAVVNLNKDRPVFSLHSACWSVVDRSTFVSSMYIRPFQPFTLSYREGLATLAAYARVDLDPSPPPRDTLLDRYDYAVVFGTEAETAQYAADSATLYRSGAVRLIRLR